MVFKIIGRQRLTSSPHSTAKKSSAEITFTVWHLQTVIRNLSKKKASRTNHADEESHLLHSRISQYDFLVVWRMLEDTEVEKTGKISITFMFWLIVSYCALVISWLRPMEKNKSCIKSFSYNTDYASSRWSYPKCLNSFKSTMPTYNFAVNPILSHSLVLFDFLFDWSADLSFVLWEQLWREMRKYSLWRTTTLRRYSLGMILCSSLTKPYLIWGTVKRSCWWVS